MRRLLRFFIISADDIQQNRFENRVALSASFVGVFLAISSIFSGQAGDDEILYRGEANNQWAYFQSKSMKENMYESDLHILELELFKAEIDSSYKSKVTEKIKFFNEEIKRYKKEKNEIKTKAIEADSVSELLGQKGDWFDMAEAFYQISLVLTAVCLIAKNSRLWHLSIGLGFFGGIFSVIALYFI